MQREKLASTVVPGFSVLGFRALNASNQIWFYNIDLPGFSALSGFRASFYDDGQSALNPGTTVPFLLPNIFKKGNIL